MLFMIVLAGMIGAGKTTFTNFLEKELKTVAYYESVKDNRILEKFYEDPKRWAFTLQVYFLNTRFKSIKEALQTKHSLLDRSIYEDALFTKINVENGNMNTVEWDTYSLLFDNLLEELGSIPKKAPDLLIYLSGSFELHLQRIRQRGREYEQYDGRPELLAYYQLLHTRYEEWFKTYDKSPTLVIPIDQVDLEREADREWVLKEVQQKVQQLSD